MRFRAVVLCSLSLAVAACGGSATPTPATPAAPSAAPPPAPAPPSGLPAAPAAVPPAPERCQPLLVADAQANCGTDSTQNLAALDTALGQQDASARNQALAALEGCSDIEPGLVRALRADLAPRECADLLVDPLLADAPDGLSLDVRHALLGLGLGARLARLADEPPKLAPPYTKQRVLAFQKKQLFGWIREQARAIHDIAELGAGIGDYGKAIVAVESGLSDMRFVQAVRKVPVPDEFADDPELEEAYYASLDQALGPRKDRGRDAALVGLRQFAELGVLVDPRVDRARALLSKLYAGSRIDALDGLLLPELPPPASDTVEQRLASRLPTFYAARLLEPADATDAKLLRALLERGLPAPVRTRLESAELSPEARRWFARGLVGLGQLYWRSKDFAKASKLVSHLGSDEARLLGALATALEQGPKDAAVMMGQGPLLPAGVGNVADLDALGKGKGAVAGMATYDAAYLLALVPRPDAGAEHWKDIARRFERAATQLGDPTRQKEARARAKAARETAEAISD